jgi:cytochrome c oxidase cbb3-type subunit III
MRHHPFSLRGPLLLGLACFLGLTLCAAQTNSLSPAYGATTQGSAHPKSYPSDQVEAGGAVFRQNCSFCHGRDATGGETGPDLTRSRLVTEDVDGDKIASVIRSGRADRGMPPFDLSADQINSLVAFIHTQLENAAAAAGRGGNGGRKGVDASDLQTGNADAGKRYFNGAGGCSACHSPTGDLAGIGLRYQGLELEEQMLYPRQAKAKITVTLRSGQTITGALAYQDEFTIGLTDSSGMYRSWRTRDVHFTVDAPAHAHVEQFSKYTDVDIHNLMAYLQTLR